MFTRRISHINFRYIINRAKVFWYEFRNPNDPWLTHDAIKILNSLLRPTDNGVEFGSGRSTIWFASRISFLTSIESDDGWYDLVSRKIGSLALDSKLDYRFCPNLEDYYMQANNFEDGSIDFCLIDGEVRDKCAIAIIKKIRSGGILVVDNINWYLPNDDTLSPDSLSDGLVAPGHWEEFLQATLGWRYIWTTNGVTDTAIWFKP